MAAPAKLILNLLSLLLMLLSALLAFPGGLSAAPQTDIQGQWTFVYFTDDIPVKTHTFTIAQLEERIGATGSEVGSSETFFLSGQINGSVLDFITTISGQQYLLFSTGTLLDAETMSGQWEDNSSASGTWNARRSSTTPTLVTPSTKLTEPDVRITGARSALLTFELFSGVGSFDAKSRISFRATAKTNFRYVAEIKRTKDQLGKKVNNDIIRKTTKKNTLTLNKLKPGDYSAKYRIEITKKVAGQEKVVGKTSFSPSAKFTIINGS